MAPSNPKSKSPIKLRRLSTWFLTLLRQSVRTNHNRIISIGLLVILFYLPTTLGVQWKALLNGSSSPLLNLGFGYLGLDALWKHRSQSSKSDTTEEDRLIGYLLILGGSALFPLSLTSLSFQALICMIIVVGVIVSNWGTKFLLRNLVPISLLIFSLYPDLLFLGNTLRKAITGDQLEYFMAWMGGTILEFAGQTTTTQGAILALAENIEAKNSVEVASGCSGFDMAFVLAGVGLCFGLFFKLSHWKTINLVAIGAALALVFNVPRVILLAYAVVYWGKGSFEFWHGPIGGQIFATILLTAYYYIAMAIIEHKPKKVS